MKGKNSIVILVFCLVSFGLLLADVVSRFEETSDLDTVKVVSESLTTRKGNQPVKKDNGPTQEELRQMIKESLMGEAGG